MARIALIDDEVLVRRLLRRALELDGHEVFEAANGKEGAALLQRESVDLVITDVMMPEKDGLELIIELRQSQPELKIIALSGGGRMAWNDVLVVARRLGAYETVAKP